MRLLIVGTLHGQLTLATKLAMDKGAAVTHAESAEQVLKVLRAGRGADLLMVDVAIDIRRLLEDLEAERIHVPIVACGTGTDARAAVAAIHAGAKEYIPLPPDPELIAAVLAAVANDSRDLVYRDEAMGKVIKLAQQIAGSDASVMVTGESGTGKEVLARYVHTRSHRAKKPFISINCAAIPEHLLESELFGHAKGAFTGATADRAGLFEQAHGGTLLLDEIGDLPLDLQAKLLRVLEESEIRRVGGRESKKVDVRVLAATAKPLDAAVERGEFRADLYYRLNVVHLHLPPLRERPDDVPALLTHFARQAATRLGHPVSITPSALDALTHHSWPGNVRELRNAGERAAVLGTGGPLEPRDFALSNGNGNGRGAYEAHTHADRANGSAP